MWGLVRLGLEEFRENAVPWRIAGCSPRESAAEYEGGGAYSIVAFLSRMTINHASLARRSIVIDVDRFKLG